MLEPRGARPGSGQPEPPYLAVLGDPDDELVRAVLAGVEEEGVPARVIPPDEGASAQEVAVAAPLAVGLSVLAGRVELTTATLPAGTWVEEVPQATVTDARRLGHNAARIVVGTSLRLAGETA